jgi:phage head maturation protease
VTAQTGTASTVHEPIGKPSGPGLWHRKGVQLPPYVQHVAHHLIAQGMDESRAIGEAVGIVKNWAEGHDGHGHQVHPDVQAAASKNIAQWEALKAHSSGKARRSAVTDMTVNQRADSRAQRPELYRSYPLEDAHVVTRAEGDGSGRLVEAYCAAFDDPAEIHDQQGHYEEEIDRTAFNKRIADVQRSRAGFSLVKCMYNHGLTIHGTPAERFSLPVAVTKHISAESKGVLTRAYYLDTPLGNEVLEMWREGAITAQSFTGAIIRSTPELRRGEKYRPRSGQLTRVRRLELGLREFGGTPFPAYDGAELVGVRMSPLGTFQAADEEYEDAALPPDEEAAPGSPLVRDDGEQHEARYHQHALYALRSREQREAAGLVW